MRGVRRPPLPPPGRHMSKQTVLISATHSAPDPLQRWWNPISQFWPRGAAGGTSNLPPVRTVPLADIVSGLASTHPDQTFGPGGPLLIALGPDFKGAALYQLVD